MNTSLSFGECLTIILDKFEITGSKLAKALNVDPSLVNKWKHDKRVVPHTSKYIEQMADYICKCIPSGMLEEVVSDLIVMFKLKMGKDEKQRCYRAIVEVLSSAKKNTKPTGRSAYLNPSDNFRILPDNSASSGNIYPIKDKIRMAKSYLPDMGIVIEGFNNIMDTALLLLKEAQKKSITGPGKIMVTYFTDTDILSHLSMNRKDYYSLLTELFKNDWKMVRLYRLSDNLQRNTSIMTEISCMISTDKFMPYYSNSPGASVGEVEMLIIPGVGALWAYNSISNASFDRALLVISDETAKLLECWFNSLLKNALPFMERYRSNSVVDILKVNKENEGRIGKRYYISHMPYFFTIPYNIIKKYAFKGSCNDKTNQFYNNSMKLFYNEIKFFSFINICSKCAIERLITDGEYIFNKIKYNIDYEDVIMYLENLIHILETYDNFYIVLLSSNQIDLIPDAVLDIREYDSVKMHYGYMDNNREQVRSYYINEPAVINTYSSYFQGIWDNLPQKKKDKSMMISWIKSQVRMLKMSENGYQASPGSIR